MPVQASPGSALSRTDSALIVPQPFESRTGGVLNELKLNRLSSLLFVAAVILFAVLSMPVQASPGSALSRTDSALIVPQPFESRTGGVLNELKLNRSSSLLFIDEGVSDYQQLVAGATPGTEVHVLDSSQDAVTQITNTLLGRSNVSSLHIFSHGEAGGLDFGSGKLNLSDLPEYATQLQGWGKALTNDADILLYGCDVAQGELGKAFVSILSQLTGADVAASNDLTGSPAKGGGWILEVNTGSIEAELALTQAARDVYAGILPFTSAGTVPVGRFPGSVVIGDFNGDGKADFATLAPIDYYFNNVSIRLGDGRGGFSGTTDIRVESPSSVVFGDFNGDGNADMAAADYSYGFVSIRLGDGRGGFSGSTEVPVGRFITSMVIGDFNGDGNADIAAAKIDPFPNNVSILLGDGRGGFSGSTSVPVGKGPVSVVIGDLNGDGKADFATANKYSHDVSIRLGDGRGGFSGSTSVPVGEGPVSIAIGDLNGDGNADFATANQDFGNQNRNSNNVSIRLGDGRGGFSGSTSLPLRIYSNPSSVVVGDFNGDGKPDIATANYGSDSISIWLGDGMGGFSGSTNIPVESHPTAAAIGDFNGDGKADIAIANQSSNNVSVLLNAYPKVTVAAGIAPAETGTTGTFILTLDTPAPAGGLTANFKLSGTATRTADYSFTDGGNITSVSANSFVIAAGATTATLNVVPVNDGIVDPGETVILTLASGNDYFLGRNTTALFVANPTVPVGSFPYFVAIGDLNGDGKADIATANSASNDVSIRLGDGLGGFSGSTNVPVGAGPYSVAIGDFNGDGKADIATANSTSNDVSIRLGNGMGGFSGSTEVPVGSLPTSVAIRDFNGDGKADIATANFASNNVSIRLGNGMGDFSGSTEVPAGPGPYSLAIRDFNRDGKADFATANSNSPHVSIRLGDGRGGFSGSTEVPLGTYSSPVSVAIGDFNGDGKADIATANFGSGYSVSIGLGDGMGGFSDDTKVVPLESTPFSVAIGDLNGDGKADFATANATFDDVSIRLGDGMGGFSGGTTLSVASNPASVAIGDFNGDGKADIATANFRSNDVSVLLNVPPAPATLTIADNA